MNRLILCASCAHTSEIGLDPLVASVEGTLVRAGLADQFAVGTVECMGACDAPLALALQGPNLASYLFAGISPQNDLDDIAATCRHYLKSPQGWITDALPCGRLRHCLRARIPALQAD